MCLLRNVWYCVYYELYAILGQRGVEHSAVEKYKK